MPDETPPDPAPEPSANLPDAVRRALLQAAELRDLEERTKEISERFRKLTPAPEQKGEEKPEGSDEPPIS